MRMLTVTIVVIVVEVEVDAPVPHPSQSHSPLVHAAEQGSFIVVVAVVVAVVAGEVGTPDADPTTHHRTQDGESEGIVRSRAAAWKETPSPQRVRRRRRVQPKGGESTNGRRDGG